MRLTQAILAIILLCGIADGGTAVAETAPAAPAYPPDIRVPTAAEMRRLDAGWRRIAFNEASAFPANTIKAIAEIRPLLNETYGLGHPIALRLASMEANSLARTGNYAEAEALFAVNVPALENRLGPDKGFTYAARQMRAANLIQMGRLTEAAAAYEQNARLVAAQTGLTPLERARLGLDLAYLRRVQGRFAEAEMLARAAYDAERSANPPQTPANLPLSLAFATASLARALTGLGRLDEAIALLDAGLAAYPAENMARARLLSALSDADAEAGRLLEAKQRSSEAAKLLLKVEGYDAPDTLQQTARARGAVVSVLGTSPMLFGAFINDGLPILLTSLKCSERVASLTDADVAMLQAATEFSGERRRDCLLTTRTFLAESLGADAPATLDVRERLVMALDSIGDSEPALDEARTLFAARLQVNSAGHPATARAALLYGQALAALGRNSEAKALLAQAARMLPVEAASAEARRLDTSGAHAEAQALWERAAAAFDTGPKQSIRLAIDIFAGRVFNALYQGRCANNLRKDLNALVTASNYALLGNIARPADEAHAILLGCERKWDEADKLYRRLSFESVSDGISFQDANLARLEARRALALMGNPALYDTAYSAARNAAFYARERRYTPDRDAAGKPLGFRREAAAAGTDPLAIAFAAVIAVDWAYEGKTVGNGTSRFVVHGGDDTFRAAQDFSQSQAAASLLEAAARAAVADPDLGRLLDRQSALAAQIVTAERASAGRADAGGDKSAIEAGHRQLAALTAVLRQRFPAYANTARPFGLTVAETRKRLQAGEALLFIQPVGEHIYSFAVSADSFAWNRARISRAEMDRLVAMVRCRIDTKTCALAMKGEYLFEGAAAASLHRELIAPVVAGFGGAQTLYTVTGGSLGSIPLGILITGKPPVQAATSEAELASLAKTSWLADAYALATLPSVSSLRAYSAAQTRTGEVAFTGIGDPVLGPAVAAARGSAGAKTANVRGSNNLAVPAILRTLNSLPGTRRELVAIARALGSPENELLLADAARETTVKSSSAFSQARIIAFATHAMLPGELDGNAEPGLVLTPTSTPTTDDDGYLTASEAAALKLRAEWVVLSACNTAGPATGGSSESLSGLARAFFYAGARSLLVSHWPVLDTVGAAITSETFRVAAARPQLSRAEALRLALRGIRSGTSILGDPIPGWQADWADPWAWAPFSLIDTGN
jgi:CHAT domain-containing protein